MLSALLDPIRQRYGSAIDSVRYRLRYGNKHVRLEPFVNLYNVSFGSYVNVAHHAQISNSAIGKRSSIGRYTKIKNAEIGRYCSISWDITIGATFHPLDHLTSHAFWYKKKFGLCEEDLEFDFRTTRIGNDVWIGCNAVIMPGVTIGNGAVIGAGSIVTKDIPPYAICAGNPAKILRFRFDDDEIELIESLAWWNWDDKKLKENILLFRRPLDEIEMVHDD